MHIIFGIPGLLVTLAILLKRLADAGIDLGGLNPFSRRRHRFARRHDADPLYTLEDPMEVAAVLMLAVARADGEITGSERKALLDAFQEDFHLDAPAAGALLSSTSHILRDGSALEHDLDGVLRVEEPLLDEAQVASVMTLLDRIAAVEGEPGPAQTGFIEQVRSRLVPLSGSRSTWG